MRIKADGMAQKQGGGVGIAAIALQGLIDEGSACRIKPGDPVVKNQQARIAGKEHGQGDQSPLLITEVADFHAPGEAEFRHESVEVLITPFGITTAEKNGCLADGHQFVNAFTILKHRNLLTEIHGQVVDVMVDKQALAGGRGASTGKQFKQRRLAEVVLGGEHGKAALGDGEIEVLEKRLVLKN